MVAVTQDSTQQSQPPQTSSAEDEVLKRNTDCVYFLASPLTCKKGRECEYRHSEYARMNPRDCYFWLNGNCLNPKCSFRHPPLDGLISTQGTTAAGSSFPAAQTVVATAAIYNRGKQVAPLNTAYYPGNPAATANGTYFPGKQTKPCIFFQQGVCSKGDACAFSHGLNPVTNKTPQAATPLATSITEPPIVKKAFGGLEKCSNVQMLPQTNVSKMTELPPAVKLAAKPRFDLLNNRNVSPNGNNMVWENDMHHQTDVSDDHSLQNGKDVDEFYKESSPGFDVLVDDDLQETDYYHEDEQFGRSNEFNINGATDYDNILADSDRDMYREPRGYESYDRNPPMASSERRLLGSDHQERRGYRNSKSPDRVEENDLRNRLSKQRRVNGLKSVINHDYGRDNRSSRKDSHYQPPHERSLSSRLQGRIRIPERSLPDFSSERELNRGRTNFSSSHHGRLQDRITGRPHDERTDFSGPKRLSELKNGTSRERKVEGKEMFSLGKRKNVMREGDVSFEGPKPLSEILKRKRGEKPLSDAREETSTNLNLAHETESSEKAPVENELEVEEGIIEDEVEETGYEEGEGEFEYEQVEEGDYIEDEGEIADPEEEYVDDDDDFDKKIGVMFS